jgi:UDP-N-acetyl-D-galactosamine dehydrogenase
VLGLTFKEDCPDIRNSRVVDILRELAEFGVEAFVHDSLASREEALAEYGVRLHAWDDLPAADALILAVAHREFLGRSLPEKIVKGGCLIDVKSVLDPAALRAAGLRVWRL